MKTHRQIRQKVRRGFTLLEVLLVLVILGVIAAMVVPRLFGVQEDSMKKTTQSSIKGLKQALDLYALAHDAKYPETIDDLLEPLDRDENPMQPYLEKYPKDAWGQRMNYMVEIDENMAGAQVARIWSNGPDGQDDDGSGDDINNWDKPEDE